MKTLKLNKSHIAEEWSEASTGDGYWIALKSGFKWSGDPLGALHTIHEPTKRKAWAETIMTCDCEDCKRG